MELVLEQRDQFGVEVTERVVAVGVGFETAQLGEFGGDLGHVRGGLGRGEAGLERDRDPGAGWAGDEVPARPGVGDVLVGGADRAELLHGVDGEYRPAGGESVGNLGVEGLLHPRCHVAPAGRGVGDGEGAVVGQAAGDGVRGERAVQPHRQPHPQRSCDLRHGQVRDPLCGDRGRLRPDVRFLRGDVVVRLGQPGEPPAQSRQWRCATAGAHRLRTGAASAPHAISAIAALDQPVQVGDWLVKREGLRKRHHHQRGGPPPRLDQLGRGMGDPVRMVTFGP